MALTDDLKNLAVAMDHLTSRLQQFTLQAAQAAASKVGMRPPGSGQAWADEVNKGRFGGYATELQLRAAIRQQLFSMLGPAERQLYDMQATALKREAAAVAAKFERENRNAATAAYLRRLSGPVNLGFGPITEVNGSFAPVAPMGYRVTAQTTPAFSFGPTATSTSPWAYGRDGLPVVWRTPASMKQTLWNTALFREGEESAVYHVTHVSSSDPRWSEFGDPRVIASILSGTRRM